MRLLGQIILVCVILAALQALLAVVALVLVFAVIVGLITKPRETWGLLFVFLILASLEAYPLATLIAGASLSCAFFIAAIHKRRRDRRGHVPKPPLLLPGPNSPIE